MEYSSQPGEGSKPVARAESDLSLEVVILLVFGVFMSLFGLLLFRIQTGELPYAPDSTYGLFLVIVSFQIITMGRTPFGDLRRSWAVILIGVCTAAVGMLACFVPGALAAPVRILVGILLFAGGIALLLQLFFSAEKARTWLKIPGILRHLTVACILVYALSIVLGLVTLLPGITTDSVTAVLLIAYGIGFFYLAWSIQTVRRLYPPEGIGVISNDPGRAAGTGLFQEASLPLSIALVIPVGALLILLGLLLFPVNLGLIPFSPDGQLGLLLVIMAVQMLALGETPVGQYRRSRLLIVIGIAFAAMGVFSCIVPGILTDVIRQLLAVLNIAGGVILLAKRFLPMLHGGAELAAPLPPILKRLLVTLTVLNVVAIAFGISMLLPGLVPAMVIAGIVVVNGLLLFALASILLQIG